MSAQSRAVHIRRLAPLALLLALAACGQNSTDLQKHLHDQYQYADNYHEALDGAAYTVDNNNVTIRTQLDFQATDGQDVCDWASEWLYGNGHDGSIKVLNRDGDVLSQRRAEADACSFG